MKNFFNDFCKSLRFTMLRHYLTPATWYILAGSLVVVNALTFYVGDLWGSNNATMSLFWGYFPFVMTVLQADTRSIQRLRFQRLPETPNVDDVQGPRQRLA